MIENEEILTILSKIRESYKNDWEKIKNDIIRKTKEIKDILIKETPDNAYKIFSNNVEKWQEELNKKVKIWSLRKTKKYQEQIKETLEKILNYYRLSELKDYAGLFKELVRIKHTGLCFWTNVATILDYEHYFPVGEKTLGKIGEKLKIKKFWTDKLYKRYFEDGINFLKTLNEIREELQIETMLEVGYYLYRYNEEISGEKVEIPKESDSKNSRKDSSNNKKLNSILHALSTKPFLILAGVSGTGKTQIARIVAGVVAGEGGETK
jgi:ABC-type glutathione transport system ATPase component